MDIKKNKLPIIVGCGCLALIVVVAVVILATGSLKLNINDKEFGYNADKLGDESGEEIDEAEVEDVEVNELVAKYELTEAPVSFGGNGKPSFTIRPPKGWLPPNSDMYDFARLNPKSDTASNGEKYSANMFTMIKSHPVKVNGVTDYQSFYVDLLKQEIPSLEVLDEKVTKLGGLDALFYEMKQTVNGEEINQYHYLVYIDENNVMMVTGNSLDSKWNEYKGILKESMDTVELGQ